MEWIQHFAEVVLHLDQHLVVLVHGLGQVLHPHHRRDLERLGQDGRVRGDTAGGEHDPLQVLVLDEHEVGEGQLVRD